MYPGRRLVRVLPWIGNKVGEKKYRSGSDSRQVK